MDATVGRPMSWRASAALLLAAGAMAGCTGPDASPGLDNPQLLLYRTEDGATQLVVRSAFKGEGVEYDRVELLLDGALRLLERNVYLATEKVNRTTFNVTLRVALEDDVYGYDGRFVVLPVGNDARLRVTEIKNGVPSEPQDRAFPDSHTLEKLASAGPGVAT